MREKETDRKEGVHNKFIMTKKMPYSVYTSVILWVFFSAFFVFVLLCFKFNNNPHELSECQE